MGRSDLTALVEALLLELGLDPTEDELPELIDVFCRHRRVLRILLTLCED